MRKAFVLVLISIFPFQLRAQVLFNLQFHYESINYSPFVHLDKGDSLELSIDHKIGTADIYFIKYTMRNELQAEKILFKKELQSSDTLMFTPESQGCYQMKVVPGARLRYFHAGFVVSLFSFNPMSGRTCTISLDSTGYMELGKEKYISGSQSANSKNLIEITNKKKQIHSNGVPFVESKFNVKKGEKVVIDLQVADDNPKTNLWVYREGDYYNTDIFRTFQSGQKVAFKVLQSGTYVVQYWGRNIFDRIDEVTIFTGR